MNQPHFEIRDGAVYWICKDVYGGTERIDRADAETFEEMGKFWARDNRNVFSCTVRLRRVDRKSFVVLNEIFAKDKRRVFYLDGIAKGIDVKTFEVLDDGNCPYDLGDEIVNGYAGHGRDKRGIYFYNLGDDEPRLIQDADPATFVSLGFTYGKDHAHAWLFGERIPQADGATFDRLSDYFARDNQNVYYERRIVQHADPKTVETLGQNYLVDSTHVFFRDSIIPKADRESFQVVDDRLCIAKGSKNTFRRNQIVKADWVIGIGPKPRSRVELFRRILTTRKENVEIVVDGQRFGAQDISRLLEEWCTSPSVCNPSEFQLSRDGQVLFELSEGLRKRNHLFAAHLSEWDFVWRLHREGLCYFDPISPSRLEEQRARVD